MQNLSAVGVLVRSGLNDSLAWKFKEKSDYDIVRRIEHITKDEIYEDRKRSHEEGQDDEEAQRAMDSFYNDLTNQS